MKYVIIQIPMYRIVLQRSKGKSTKHTDHANNNGLDNQRRNLRYATRSQNRCNAKLQCNNTSGYKGVGWYEKGHNWRARIRVNNTLIHLGCFKYKTQAARAYNKAAKKYHKQFAKLNPV